MILKEGALVILDCGDGSELEAVEMAAPSCVSTGLESVEVNGVMAEDGCVLWLARWLCGLELAFASRPHAKPDFAKIYESVALLHGSYRLETMQAQNDLPL